MQQLIAIPGCASGVLLCVNCCAAAPCARQDLRDVLLYYFTVNDQYTEANVRDSFRRAVAYQDTDGQPVDWLFDSIALYSIEPPTDLFLFDDQTYDACPGPGGLENNLRRYLDELFGDGVLQPGILQILSDVVAETSSALGSPRVLKVFLTAPYVPRLDPPTRYTQELIDRWRAAAFPNLALVGFYSGYQESIDWDTCLPQSSNIVPYADLAAIGASVHGQGYRLLWMPYLEAWGIGYWRELGLDWVNIQPGYAWRDPPNAPPRLADAELLRKSYGLSGVHLEVPAGGTVQDPAVNAAAYLDAEEAYGWGDTGIRSWYYATPTYYDSEHNVIGNSLLNWAEKDRAIYERIYQRIRTPRNLPPQLAIPDRIATRGDADVINSLDIDTDSCPPCPSCPGLPCTPVILRDRQRGWADVQMANSIRPLMQFDLRGLPSAAVVTGLSLDFSVAEFCQETAGTNEGLVEVLDDDNWDEFDPTWNNMWDKAAAQIGQFEFATGWLCNTGLRTSQEVALDISAGLPWAQDGLLSVILRRLHEDVAEYDADPAGATWSRYYLAGIRTHEEVGIHNPQPYRGPLLHVTASVPDEPPPRILRTAVTPTCVEVEFSKPMERRPTEQAIWVEAGTTLVPVTYAWSADARMVTLTPTVAIAPSATLALSVGPTARDRTGRFLLLDADHDGVLDDCDVCLNTIPGAAVDAAGCPPVILGDFDRDGDVDEVDLQRFAACAAGPSIPYSPTSPPAGCDLPAVNSLLPCDFDENHDCDLDDFGAFQRCHSGINRPADAGCTLPALEAMDAR